MLGIIILLLTNSLVFGSFTVWNLQEGWSDQAPPILYFSVVTNIDGKRLHAHLFPANILITLGFICKSLLKSICQFTIRLFTKNIKRGLPISC